MISNSLDIDEVNDLWEQLGNSKFAPEDFQSEVLQKHCSTERGLTKKGLLSLLAAHFSQVGEEEAKAQLARLGYDDALWGTFSRSFIISMHSDKELEVQLGDAVDTNLDDAAIILDLESNGLKKISNPEVCLMHSPGESAVDAYTFGAKNMCSVPLQVTFSVAPCGNCAYSASEPEVVRTVEPGQTEFLMHVRRADLAEELKMNHLFKFREVEEE